MIMLPSIPGYKIIEKIQDEAETQVYRAESSQDRRLVLLRLFKAEYPAPIDLKIWEYEYEITRDLNISGIIKPHRLEQYNNSYIFIFDNFDGLFLRDIISTSKKIELIDFLKIALQLAKVLGEIHEQNIIHKDIRPDNIIVNPKNYEIKLTGFGVSSIVAREKHESCNFNFRQEALAYIAPEQIGRINHSADYRVDFYALGITFYELLTGQLPFSADDPLELVHHHVARQASSPTQLNNNVPEVISKIILKLIAKNAEDRYQSSYGLKQDLEICLKRVQNKLEIEDFVLGQDDKSERLLIPQKIYGREQELAALINAFEEVSNGTLKLCLISGQSGIGKTALVNELRESVAIQKGSFISGKSDQLELNSPYGLLGQAFGSLIRQLLSENESKISNWKNNILEALPKNAQIIVDVIPELELLIGKQLPVEELAPIEAQNRFNLVFQRFLKALTKSQSPIVVFLDDLQWADSASLKLIDYLIKSGKNHYLLFIGAYRNDEINEFPSLKLIFDRINETDSSIHQINLQPLDLIQIENLISDVLNSSQEKVSPLANLVLRKTNGNPFFINQFLKSLYQKGLLNFQSHTGHWEWNLKNLEETNFTDNVLELMVEKIEKLSCSTQNTLKLAACIGNEFDLALLSATSEMSLKATVDSLWEVIEEELILPTGDTYGYLIKSKTQDIFDRSDMLITFKFTHDRIQQAFYQILLEEERQHLHYKIGKSLLANITLEPPEVKAFDIVNYLNLCPNLIASQEEKYYIAQLNLAAAKKSISAIAYSAALKYLKSGTNLLASDCWADHFELTFGLYTELAKCEYLCGNFERANYIFEILLHNSRTEIEKVEVYSLKIILHTTLREFKEVIEQGKKGLSLLGWKIPERQSRVNQAILLEITKIKFHLFNLNISEAINLPNMVSVNQISMISLMAQVIPALYYTNPSLSDLFYLKMASLSLKYGVTATSSMAFAGLARFLGERLGDFESRYEFGKLALTISEKFDNPILKGNTLFLFSGFINHWNNHAKFDLDYLKQASQISIESGNFVWACYANNVMTMKMIVIGNNLDLVSEAAQKAIEFAYQTGEQFTPTCLLSTRQFTFCLKGLTTNSMSFGGDSFDEIKHEELLRSTSSLIVALNWYQFLKLEVLYIFNDFSNALKIALELEESIVSVKGLIHTVDYYFYYSLTLTALYSSFSYREKKRYRKILNKNQSRMKKWAYHCPKNFLHKYFLVSAEISCIDNQKEKAIELYHRAIQSAIENNYIQNQAIANELAGKFYLSNGFDTVAKPHLREASYCYLKWGATAKVQALEKKYSQLLFNLTASELTSLNSWKASSSIGYKDLEFLVDIKSVLKASQALSGEIILETLLTKLMRIVIENAGAQKGFLILHKEGNWVIEAEATVDSDNVRILRSISLDTIDDNSQTPYLSSAVVNYVIHSQENIVLNDAFNEGQFSHDPYIVATQAKSILGHPLLNQGKLNGILYLENNLTAGAFTTERLEVLKVLSAQAAISIENARLYQQLEEYNRNLEQKVEKRTKELTQTVAELKKVEAQLVFENELLRNADLNSYEYQVGGALAPDSHTYVVRQADRDLHRFLKEGHYCFILNARQMGKSSLCARIINLLQQTQEFACCEIDLNEFSSKNITEDKWYADLVAILIDRFELREKINFRAWWRERLDNSSMRRVSEFIETILLPAFPQQKITIFIDEIDKILTLNFDTDSFFTLLRALYNRRSINSDYKRLNFVLLGVANPCNLIQDSEGTPFNIGKAITLEPFKLEEIEPLIIGLKDKFTNPHALLKEVLSWTGGQPFLTQKTCQLIHDCTIPLPEGNEKPWVEKLIYSKIIEDWEAKDMPEHLTSIRARLLSPQSSTLQLLKLYQQILDSGEVHYRKSLIEKELLLTGLIRLKKQLLCVYNRIYETVFNRDWVEKTINLCAD
ncbi:MAG: AAA family ATPase [Prochloraceae cyanobacterium]|nr:AAA family ATPase [Prochloraceae cyanobacterium]